MRKRILYSLLAGCLSVLLLFGTTSKEFVHLFAAHEDTVHAHQCNTGDLQVDNEHHHCSFLSFTLAPFANDITFPSVSIVPTWYYIPVHTELSTNYTRRDIANISLRGPPVAV